MITTIGWTLAILFLVLPGPQALDAIPVFNLLNVKRLGWPTVHLVLLAYAGAALGVSTLGYARITRGACQSCGRREPGQAANAGPWERAGLILSSAALVAPCGYAITRLSWAAGVPIGTSRAFLDQINAANPGDGTALLEITMATMAVSGGILCFGLTRKWSQIWPRWLPNIGGRAVPHALPVTLGLICGVGLASWGLTLLPGLLNFISAEVSGRIVYFTGTDVPTNWISHLPALCLMIWGPLVIAATLAFHFRTAGPCRRCGPNHRAL